MKEKNRDERLIQNKKRLSEELDSLFEKIIVLLVQKNIDMKEWNYHEFKKYDGITKFKRELTKILNQFQIDNDKEVKKMLIEEFKTSWKETNKKNKKRQKMPKKEDIEKIANFRNRNDGLTITERNDRNLQNLNYTIYSTIQKNLQQSQDFNQLIKQDLQKVKKDYMLKKQSIEIQHNQTSAESMAVVLFVAMQNGKYQEAFERIVGESVDDKKDDEDKFELMLVTVGDKRVCSKCQSLDGQRFPADGSFTIPDSTHVNCRCQLIMVSKEHI